MKRTIVMSIVFGILIFIASASYAQDIDLSQMTIEELALLQTRVNQELKDRFDFEDLVFLPGRYVVRVNIAEENYTFTNKTVGYTTGLTLFSSEGKEDKYRMLISCTVNAETHCSFGLSEGMILHANGADCYISEKTIGFEVDPNSGEDISFHK